MSSKNAPVDWGYEKMKAEGFLSEAAPQFGAATTRFFGKESAKGSTVWPAAASGFAWLSKLVKRDEEMRTTSVCGQAGVNTHMKVRIISPRCNVRGFTHAN